MGTSVLRLLNIFLKCQPCQVKPQNQVVTNAILAWTDSVNAVGAHFISCFFFYWKYWDIAALPSDNHLPSYCRFTACMFFNLTAFISFPSIIAFGSVLLPFSAGHVFCPLAAFKVCSVSLPACRLALSQPRFSSYIHCFSTRSPSSPLPLGWKWHYVRSLQKIHIKSL